MEIANLEAKAKELRRHIISMLAEAGSGHPGGSLSAADLVTALYYDEMNVDPKNPAWDGRDYFVLSKGQDIFLLRICRLCVNRTAICRDIPAV